MPSDTNSIAGYTVAEITHDGVQLQSADKKQTLQLKIGDVMRQNNGDLAAGPARRIVHGHGRRRQPGPAADWETLPPPEASSARRRPQSRFEGNDILRRLMEQRQKELGNKPSGN